MQELDTVHKKVLAHCQNPGCQKTCSAPLLPELKEVQAAKKPTQAETVAAQKASKTTPRSTEVAAPT